MSVDEQVPAPLSFPRPVWVALGLFGAAMLVFLAGQFVLIREQRDIVHRQERLARAQLTEIRPAVREAVPLLDAARRGLPRARVVAAHVDRLASAAAPLAEDLRAAGLPGAARELGVFLRALDPAAVAQDVSRFGEAARALTDRGRLERALRSTITVLGTVRSTRLVGKLAEAVPRLDRTQVTALAILRRTLSLQRTALAVNRRNLATAEATLAVARQTQSHAASLDEKLAGPLLGTGGG